MLTLYLRQPARLNAQHWFVTITPGGTVFQLGPQQVSFAGDIVLTFPNANRFMGTFNRAVQWQTTGVIVEIHGMASGAPKEVQSLFGFVYPTAASIEHATSASNGLRPFDDPSARITSASIFSVRLALPYPIFLSTLMSKTLPQDHVHSPADALHALHVHHPASDTVISSDENNPYLPSTQLPY